MVSYSTVPVYFLSNRNEEIRSPNGQFETRIFPMHVDKSLQIQKRILFIVWQLRYKRRELLIVLLRV